MARLGDIVKNNRRKSLVEKYAPLRKKLKDIINSVKSSQEEVELATKKIQSIPRNASPVRLHNRCKLTGRPRGYMRQFGISRVTFREMANQGLIPGVKKASW